MLLVVIAYASRSGPVGRARECDASNMLYMVSACGARR